MCRLEQGWSSFNYLAGSESFRLGEVDDGEAFRDTMDAMAIVGLVEVVRLQHAIVLTPPGILKTVSSCCSHGQRHCPVIASNLETHCMCALSHCSYDCDFMVWQEWHVHSDDSVSGMALQTTFVDRQPCFQPHHFLPVASLASVSQPLDLPVNQWTSVSQPLDFCHSTT